MTDDEILEHARRAADRLPPLTDEQRAKLAVLLNPDTPVYDIAATDDAAASTRSDREHA